MRLTEKHQQAIQLMILDRFQRQDQSSWIAEKLGVKPAVITAWKNDQEFRDEYHRQLDIYKSNFDDIRLADRKERVRVLSDLFDVVQDSGPREARLKMAILEQIRMEMGIGEASEVHHLHAMVGVNLPPRADSYEEWVAQNKKMDRMAVEASVEVLDDEVDDEP